MILELFHRVTLCTHRVTQCVTLPINRDKSWNFVLPLCNSV